MYPRFIGLFMTKSHSSVTHSLTHTAKLYFDLRTEILIPPFDTLWVVTVVAFTSKSLVYQNILVQPWESCPKTRDLGLIRSWISIREGRPEILKYGVPWCIFPILEPRSICHSLSYYCKWHFSLFDNVLCFPSTSVNIDWLKAG